jgi:hypothetical protein
MQGWRLTSFAWVSRDLWRDGVIEFIPIRLLLDSRVVDLPMAYNPTLVILSSLKPLFFNRLQNELCFSDNTGA